MEQALERIRQQYAHIASKTAHYMQLAREAMERDDPNQARLYLILLCRETDNYEESLEFNGLTELWDQYRHLVEGLVPPSLCTRPRRALPPEKCSQSIAHILALPQNELLAALSTHVQERTANGSALQCLNKWERTFYYADELCMEVNSGGFEGYLYYQGLHFERAYAAFQAIGAIRMRELLNAVREKFPRGRVPSSVDALQNAMDAMVERDVDFEDEDEIYYSVAEKELLERLAAYVLENKQRFR